MSSCGWSLPRVHTAKILVRLAANDLICYKLVCKAWESLISSSDFMSAHFTRSKTDLSHHFLFVLEYQIKVFPIVYPDPIRSIASCLGPYVVIVGSANGLICIVPRTRDRKKVTPNDIWILNPVTGHSLKLPPSESSVNPYFDHTFVVFWWDADEDDGEYKVAKIVCKPNSSNTTVASLWASGSPETWSEIKHGFQGSFYNPAFNSVASACDAVIGDVAYWIVFKFTCLNGRVVKVRGLGWDVEGVFVLSLNLKTLSLSLSTNPFPLHFQKIKSVIEQYRMEDNSFLFAAKWKNSFAMVEKNLEKKTFDVWTVSSKGRRRWSKVYSFADNFHIKRCVSNIQGKSVIMGMTNKPPYYSGLRYYEIGNGKGKAVEGYNLGKLVFSAHDFVGSFESIKGFKHPKSYDIGYFPQLTIVWPYPSTSITRYSGLFTRKGEHKFSRPRPRPRPPVTLPDLISFD